MKILSIETSCDETAAAIVENGNNVLSSVILSQIDIHKKYGGVVPEIASRQHCENISSVTLNAIEKAKISLNEIDAIAVTYAPGLVGALLVGINFAKGLSLSLNKPVIPIHHIKAHISSAYLENKDLSPPFIAMVMSGGHTHIIEVTSHTMFNIIGQTVDDAIGEVYDKIARSIGLSYPGGKYIDELAQTGNPFAYKFPKPKVKDNKYNFSFSGLKTAVINLIHNNKQKNINININDLSASFQHTICEIIEDKLISYVLESNYNKIVLAGGVACNSGIRKYLSSICKSKNIKIYTPSPYLCTDNAVMVGIQAFYEFKANNFADLDLNAIPYLPIDS